MLRDFKYCSWLGIVAASIDYWLLNNNLVLALTGAILVTFGLSIPMMIYNYLQLQATLSSWYRASIWLMWFAVLLKYLATILLFMIVYNHFQLHFFIFTLSFIALQIVLLWSRLFSLCEKMFVS